MPITCPFRFKTSSVLLFYAYFSTKRITCQERKWFKGRGMKNQISCKLFQLIDKAKSITRVQPNVNFTKNILWITWAMDLTGVDNLSSDFPPPLPPSIYFDRALKGFLSLKISQYLLFYIRVRMFVILPLSLVCWLAVVLLYWGMGFLTIRKTLLDLLGLYIIDISISFYSFSISSHGIIKMHYN